MKIGHRRAADDGLSLERLVVRRSRALPDLDPERSVRTKPRDAGIHGAARGSTGVDLAVVGRVIYSPRTTRDDIGQGERGRADRLRGQPLDAGGEVEVRRVVVRDVDDPRHHHMGVEKLREAGGCHDNTTSGDT